MKVDLYQVVLSVDVDDDFNATDFEVEGERTTTCRKWMEADPEFKAMIDDINAAVVKAIDDVYGEKATSEEISGGMVTPAMSAVVETRNAAHANGSGDEAELADVAEVQRRFNAEPADTQPPAAEAS